LEKGEGVAVAVITVVPKVAPFLVMSGLATNHPELQILIRTNAVGSPGDDSDFAV